MAINDDNRRPRAFQRARRRLSGRVRWAARTFAVWAAVELLSSTGAYPSGDSDRADQPALSERVELAVRAGRKSLAPRLTDLQRSPRSDYPLGRLAIVAAALLSADMPPGDTEMQRAMMILTRREAKKTYCAATTIFALDIYLRAIERAEKEESLDVDVATANARLGELVDWLLAAESRQRGAWSYSAGNDTRRHDFSNTQFAILALRVGLARGVEIPARHFADMASTFVRAQLRDSEAERTVRLEPEATLEEKLGLVRPKRPRAIRAVPSGWGYRTPRRPGNETARASMTLAGASSIVIAIDALERTGNRRWKRELAAARTALDRAYAWIDAHFDAVVADGKGLCYTLYSLEKVGDLAGVARIGDRDWYREGCQRLLGAQRPSGSWGAYTDTALALLYLKRSTRSLRPAAAPVLLTRGESAAGETTAGDLVYIEAANGFLSAREILDYAGTHRHRRLVPTLREVVRNFDPRRRAKLVPWLLPLWRGSDSITRFARSALGEIVGERLRQPDDARRWLDRWRAVTALDVEGVETSALVEVLEVTQNLRLRAEVIRIARKHKKKGVARALVRDLTASSIAHRRLAHGILCLWTGAQIEAPRDDGDVRSWQSTAEAWVQWFRANPR